METNTNTHSNTMFAKLIISYNHTITRSQKSYRYIVILSRVHDEVSVHNNLFACSLHVYKINKALLITFQEQIHSTYNFNT